MRWKRQLHNPKLDQHPPDARRNTGRHLTKENRGGTAAGMVERESEWERREMEEREGEGVGVGQGERDGEGERWREREREREGGSSCSNSNFAHHRFASEHQHSAGIRPCAPLRGTGRSCVFRVAKYSYGWSPGSTASPKLRRACLNQFTTTTMARRYN